MLRNLLSFATWSVDAPVLVLRIVFCGLMIYQHAFSKLTLFGESPESFPDPLGIGSVLSFYLVIFAEVICALFVLVGFLTRLALIPLLVNMAVALLRVHWENDLFQKELPLLYLAVFAAIFWLGPGRWSVDYRLWRRRPATVVVG